MQTKWTNVPVSFTVELGREGEGPWQDLTYEKELPPTVRVEICGLCPIGCEGLELDFDVYSSGYHQPMSMYGGPDRLGWPEEGDDERECKGVYILEGGANNRPRYPLSKASADLLEALYQEEIQAADLPEQDDGDCG